MGLIVVHRIVRKSFALVDGKIIKKFVTVNPLIYVVVGTQIRTVQMRVIVGVGKTVIPQLVNMTAVLPKRKKVSNSKELQGYCKRHYHVKKKTFFVKYHLAFSQTSPNFPYCNISFQLCLYSITFRFYCQYILLIHIPLLNSRAIAFSEFISISKRILWKIYVQEKHSVQKLFIFKSLCNSEQKLDFFKSLCYWLITEY